ASVARPPRRGPRAAVRSGTAPDGVATPTMTDAATQGVGDGVDAVFDEVVEWRRHLHRYPEVSFQERETAAWIAETLATFGDDLEVERPAENAVVAHLRTGRPGPVVALR